MLTLDLTYKRNPVESDQFQKADKISLKMKAKAVIDEFMKSDHTKNDINTNWCIIKIIIIIMVIFKCYFSGELIALS